MTIGRRALSVDGYMRLTTRRLLEGLADKTDDFYRTMDQAFHRRPGAMARASVGQPSELGHRPYWQAKRGDVPLSDRLKMAEDRRRRSVTRRGSAEHASVGKVGTAREEGFIHATCVECRVIFWRRHDDNEEQCGPCRVQPGSGHGVLGDTDMRRSIDSVCPECEGPKTPSAKTCRPCMPKRRAKKRKKRKKREAYRYEDPEAHLGPLLVACQRGWRFQRDVKGFGLLTNIKAGYVLYREPWQSCRLTRDPVTGLTFTEPWSIGTETRRMGIPADWAHMLLAAAGLAGSERTESP